MDESTKDRPVLETDRLLLRRPDRRDSESIMAIAGDWEVARRLARIPHPYEKADAEFFIDVIVPNEWVWAITWRSSGPLIGMVGLSPGTERDVAELGYLGRLDHGKLAPIQFPERSEEHTSELQSPV